MVVPDKDGNMWSSPAKEKSACTLKKRKGRGGILQEERKNAKTNRGKILYTEGESKMEGSIPLKSGEDEESCCPRRKGKAGCNLHTVQSRAPAPADCSGHKGRRAQSEGGADDKGHLVSEGRSDTPRQPLVRDSPIEARENWVKSERRCRKKKKT